MIRIDVEEYCQSCQDFCPDVTEPVKAYAVGNEAEYILSDTIIRCKYRRRCAGMMRYLEHQVRGDTNG